MKLKSILAITFALVFVVAFIAPSLSAGWLFGEKTGDAKSAVDNSKSCTGTVSGDIGSFNKLQNCTSQTATLQFISPSTFNKNVLIDETLAVKGDIACRGDLEIKGNAILPTIDAVSLNATGKSSLGSTVFNGNVQFYNDVITSKTIYSGGLAVTQGQYSPYITKVTPLEGLHITGYSDSSAKQIRLSNNSSNSSDYDYVLGVDGNGVFRISQYLPDSNGSVKPYLKMIPNSHASVFEGPVSVNDDLEVDGTVHVTGSLIMSNDYNLPYPPALVISGLSGQGNAYVCVNSQGQLYRSNTQCR